MTRTPPTIFEIKSHNSADAAQLAMALLRDDGTTSAHNSTTNFYSRIAPVYTYDNEVKFMWVSTVNTKSVNNALALSDF